MIGRISGILLQKTPPTILVDCQGVGYEIDYMHAVSATVTAEQLNALYQLSGHSDTADATLGRLYEIKLRDAEQSSNAEIANLAQKMRKQVADQFFRIHSSNPAPVEQ